MSLSQIFETLSPEDTFVANEMVGKLFVFYFIVFIYAMFGILDDLFHPKKRYDKILAILLLSFPVAFLVEDTLLNFFITEIIIIKLMVG